MVKVFRTFIFMLPILCWNAAFANDERISEGMKALAVDKTETAIKTWAKDSPAITEKIITEFVKEFDRLRNQNGNYVGSTLIGKETIVTGYQIHYICIRFESGCAFLKMNYYTYNDKLVLQRIALNEDPERILPHRFLEMKYDLKG
jgi:hypothetical protein